MRVSRIGLGLSRLHYISRTDGAVLIRAALDLGVTHFDTARLYGDGLSEAVLGASLGTRRADVTVATKFGILPSAVIERAGPLAHPLRGARSALRRIGLMGQPRRAYSVATLDAALGASLRRLRTDYVDILFLHDPLAGEVEGADDLFAELEKRKASGMVRAVGVAADGQEVTRILARYGDAVDVVQVPETRWPPDGIMPDITFGALGGGPQVYGAAGPQPDAARSGLRRALSRRRTGCLLVGTTKPAHLAELVRAASETAP